jgi:hypothetical protein
VLDAKGNADDRDRRHQPRLITTPPSTNQSTLSRKRSMVPSWLQPSQLERVRVLTQTPSRKPRGQLLYSIPEEDG